MLGHTPGPWITDTSHWQDREGVTIWAESNIIADVVPDGHNQEQSNARLIAVAPELLRIVKTLEGAWDSELKMPQCGIEAELEFEGAIDEAREAIAKAEGRE